MRMAPTPRAVRLVVSNSRRLSTHIGRIGSAARRSANAKPTSSTVPTAKTAMLVGELQAQAWPPSSTPRMSRVMALVSSTAPA